jgi:RimJ/RimL family protein N-acetyltransferase
MPTLCIPVGSPVEGTLRPVATRKDGLNVNDVRVLTEWRNRFVRAFLHEFEATERRTERWLTDMVGPDDTRILFMLDDPHGQTVGYMGLAYIDWEKLYGEADAIVRGRDVAPGLMTKAMRTLMNWASGQLGLQLLGVRVRSDNTALDFYRKFGFKEHRRVPLRVKQEIDGLKWDEDLSLSAGEISLVHMLFPSSTTHG